MKINIISEHSIKPIIKDVVGPQFRDLNKTVGILVERLTALEDKIKIMELKNRNTK